MNKNNDFDVPLYLFIQIPCMLTFYYFYSSVLFRPIWGFSDVHSRFLLYGLLIVSFIIGFLLCFRDNRNSFFALVNSYLPFNLFFLFSVPIRFRVAVYVEIGLIVMLSILFCWIMFNVKYPHETPEFHKKYFFRRIKKCLLGIRSIAAICIAPFIITYILTTILVQYLPPKGTLSSDQLSQYTMANNVTSIVNILDKPWQTLKKEDKLDTLQTIANIEAHHLGLSTSLIVVVEESDDPLCIASYRDKDKKIYVNPTSFTKESGEVLLNSICHEVFHAYQYALIELYSDTDPKYRRLYTFDGVKDYKEEFSSYYSASEDPEQYYAQKCETDARAYAEEATKEYRQFIDYYLYTGNFSSTTR